MVRIGGLAAADQTGFGGNEPQVLLVAVAAGLGNRQRALVDAAGLNSFGNVCYCGRHCGGRIGSGDGVDGRFREAFGDRLQEASRSLLEGFLSLGLLIGIAGLGVVMVRAVRERRREIGMLRAIGFAARIVRRAFMIEASFIAVQGIAIGGVLGLVTGFSVLTSSSTFGPRNGFAPIRVM